MMRRIHALLFALLSALALVVVACGTDGDASQFGEGDPDADVSTGGGDATPPPILGGDGSADLDAQAIAITPADQIVTFVSGMPAPTVQYVATTTTGVQVPASFTIDRGEIGSVGLASGLFTATGGVGGKAIVTATWNGKSATTTITVKLSIVENGASATGADAGADAGDAGNGAGGSGGVGGEGPGGAVDAATLAALKGAPAADTGLSFLYPYDKTVWPRGILAPLLQWKAGAQGDYDAVRIQIAESAFTYDGTFAKTATPFVHHPITQTAWKQMALSNAGEDVTVTLTFAKGGAAYGPITETWKIASAPLKGVVYYNSYGTKLAKNFTGAVGGDGKFGAATLAIKGGSTDPVLIAGATGDQTQCRVCHSVAANGSYLVTQRNLGDQRKFSAYDLKTGAETILSPEGATANFAWPAIYPDGSMFLGDSSSAAGSTTAPNQLFSMPTGAGPVTPTVVATTGWPAGFRAAYPAFSPDGKQLAFTLFAGDPAADKRSLGVMTFDGATKTFGTITKVFSPADLAMQTALFPSFLPTNDGIVFEVELRYNTRDYGGTRSDADIAPPDPKADRGTRAELWWLDLKATPPVAHRLDALNGYTGGTTPYLPTGPNAHDADWELNYEPTVNPVPSGGYAWVVFTSRRLYGNVATINPFYSDPRYHDLTSTPTPKKLWVAAIDLNAPPGTDPSHPAFYLPAQELLAGNSRGYWVVDPCKSDGNACETGDECCGGFCRPDGTTGALVCTDKTPTCAHEFEKCSVDTDCCNTPAYQCINGRCALPLPR
jgi:hypothetical protein